ncbi:MAG: alanine racemase [Alphaproteobacteria bacterium]|nr:alanine racemase [Alphaproteobacteria bacterium]
MTYAVGIVPAKLAAIAELQRRGASVTLLLDSLAMVRAVAEAAAGLDATFSVLVEIDTGGRRGGVEPESPALLAIGRAIYGQAPRLQLKGVLTHAGQSYHGRSAKEIEAIAEQERAGVVRAAERVRAASLPCPVVSAGSTPTVIQARALDGVTEVRPGVYTLCDLDQVGLGSCDVGDIAASVLATVIGHNRSAGRVLVDAGGLALSKDVSAQEFMPDVGYGLVCPAEGGAPIPGLLVDSVHQEHGLIAARTGELPWDRLPIGARVRILPNHVCMTVAPYDRYHVVEGGTDVVAVWDKATGWH